MWFQVLSLVIAAALLGKASIALVTRQRFYAARQRQYASGSQPLKLLIGPTLVGTLTGVAWYATFFHYQPAGWIVTGFLTALSCMVVHHLFRWTRHRQVMLRVVANPMVWLIDCVLVIVGGAFVALALLVY